MRSCAAWSQAAGAAADVALLEGPPSRARRVHAEHSHRVCETIRPLVPHLERISGMRDTLLLLGNSRYAVAFRGGV
jgi:hypothetical protein